MQLNSGASNLCHGGAQIGLTSPSQPVDEPSHGGETTSLV